MKLKALRLKNFANFSNFEIEFDESITRLVGMNGSGKTTIGLTAIWAGFKGIAERVGNNQLVGERFRFIGIAGKSADIEIVLVDEAEDVEILIKRHITKSANQITFKAPDGYLINETWLDNLLNVSFLSAKHFTSLGSKEQALALGIETSEFDDQIAELKSEAKDIRRDIKAMGEIVSVPEVKSVDVQKLIEERDAIDKFNKKQDEISAAKEEAQDHTINLYGDLEMLKRQVAEKDEELLEAITLHDGMIDAVPLQDRSQIDNQIASVNETNIKATTYSGYLTKKKNHEQKSGELEENLCKQVEIVDKKLEYIKSFNFGTKGLSVNDDGELMMKDRPIKEPYFSRSELEIMIAYLYSSINPTLKMRFIDDFECLDDTNQKKLIDKLLKDGFQIITAEVGDTPKDSNSIFLRECKIVE